MLDPIQIGDRIRKFRKQQKIRLEDLTDVFSIGKLSNIEKGKVPVSLEDIKKLCERLKVPLEDIIQTQLITESESAISDLKRIRYLLTLDSLRTARALLKITKNKINEFDIKHLTVEIDFYYGAYMLRRNDEKFARVYFKKVIENTANHEHAKQFKIRAYNALTYIEFKSGKISLAWQYNNMAKETVATSLRKLIDDESNVYFNSSIIALFLGNFNLAQRNAQTAIDSAEGSFEQLIRFVLAVIQLLNLEFSLSKINLDMCMEYFSREEEVENLSRASLLQYYMYNKYPEKYKNEIPIVEDNMINLVVENTRNHEIVNRRYLSILQTVLVVAIDHQQYDFAKRIIEALYIYQQKSPNVIQGYKTYYLEARLVRETTMDKSNEKILLEKALSLINDSDFLEKAMMLHELNNISGVQKGILYESNTIFYNLLKLGQDDFRVIKHLLPDLRY